MNLINNGRNPVTEIYPSGLRGSPTKRLGLTPPEFESLYLRHIMKGSSIMAKNKEAKSSKSSSGAYVYRDFIIQDMYTQQSITRKDVNVMCCFSWLEKEYALRGYTLEECDFNADTRFLITQFYGGQPTKTWAVVAPVRTTKGKKLDYTY